MAQNEEKEKSFQMTSKNFSDKHKKCYRAFSGVWSKFDLQPYGKFALVRVLPLCDNGKELNDFGQLSETLPWILKIGKLFPDDYQGIM